MLKLASAVTVGCGLFFGIAAGPANAGEITLPKPETAKSESDWQFKLSSPGWLPAMAGKIGMNGYNTQMYVGADTVVKDLDFAASVAGEVRKGNVGFAANLLYLSDSDGQDPGGLLQKVDVRLESYISEVEFNYRIWESRRGFVDVRLGVRYTNLYNKVSTQADDQEIDNASEQFVNDVSSTIRGVLSGDISKEELAGMLDDAADSRLGQRIDELPMFSLAPEKQREEIRRLFEHRFRKFRPELARLTRRERVAALEAMRAAAKERLASAEGVAEEDVAKLRAVAARAALVREEAQKKLGDYKKKVQKDLAGSLKNNLDTNASVCEYWFDPYIGFRGRFNFTDAFYITGAADVGGFTVGSDIAYQLYGALGYQLTRSISTEVGYRYLYTDYNKDNFLYRVDVQGAQVTLAVTF